MHNNRLQHIRNSPFANAITYIDSAIDKTNNKVDKPIDMCGRRAQPFAGMVCSVKACFDVQGWVTHGGSKAFARRPRAIRDAAIVSTVRQLGADILMQTNMTEFAYGALGINHSYGTPVNPLPGYRSCVAGGSSSGAAVSVATHFADLAIGSDTSGSVRIPAAFCGVVGYIPTRGYWSTAGMLGLAPSFDTPGILTRTAAMCRNVAMAIHRESGMVAISEQSHKRLSDYTLLVPKPMDTMIHDAAVGDLFVAAMARLRACGVRLIEADCKPLAGLNQVIQQGQINAVEAYLIHKPFLTQYGRDYEPLIRARIEAGKQVPAHLYAQALFELQQRQRAFEDVMHPYDAVFTPTVPVMPPLIATLAKRAHYLHVNQQVCTLTEYANALGIPSISLPTAANSPVGVLLTGKTGSDASLLHLACLLEKALTSF